MAVYHFNVSGYIEVTANSKEEALEQIKQHPYESPKAWTIYDDKDKTFVYVVPVGFPVFNRNEGE